MGDPAGPGRPQDAVASLRRTIESHRPGDEREAAARLRMMAELDRLDHPFDEGADPTHVTASAVVVGARGVVLHKHRRLGRWMQPGGHVDPGEAPDEAAVRECTEETGLAVRHPDGGPQLLHVDVHEAAKGHTHLDLRYLLLAPDAEPAPPPEESQDVAWFTWEAAAEVADEALSGALRVARRVTGAEPGPTREGE